MKPTGKKPYFTAKALAGILSGDNQCQAALWVKSRFWAKRLPSTFDFVTWEATHNAMVAKRKGELEALGYTVTIENANKFELEGATARVTGKPDIISIKGDDVLIPDCKSGSQRSTDFWQVLVYLACVPIARKDLAGKRISGELVYEHGVIEIPPEELTDERRAAIFAKVRELAREQPFPYTPSPSECGFCDLAECTARMQPVPPTPTEVF